MKPDERELIAIVEEVVKKHGTVKSQHDLAELVVKEVRKKYPGFLLSSKRARAIALKAPGVGVKVHTKKSGADKPETCPACGSGLSGLYARNLLNERVLIGLSCENCGYSGVFKKFAPFRYEFYPRKNIKRENR